MAVQLWKRAVMKRNDSRWPKKCLKKEIREIINADTTKSGKELKATMEGVSEGAI